MTNKYWCLVNLYIVFVVQHHSNKDVNENTMLTMLDVL